MNEYLDQFGNLTSEYYGYVYLTIDQKRNLVYIGQKKGKPEKTKNYFGSGTVIFNIIKSRGYYFLKKIVLGVCYTKEELTFCETECKYHFDVWNKLYGYNIAIKDDGGAYLQNHPNRDEICKKISLSKLGKPNLKLVGHFVSEETKQKLRDYERTNETKEKMSKAKKGICIGEKNNMFGKHHTIESKLKMGEKLSRVIFSQERKDNISKKTSGKNNPRAVKIDVLKILELRKNGMKIKDIAKQFNVNDSVIQRRLKNPEKYL